MALNKTMTFDLELKPGGIPPIVHASQGDIGRMFKANIYWDGSAATSYVSGATVNLRGRKPDKTVFDYSATLAGSMVTFETTEQMTIISGPVECELVFSNDGDIIASANFLLIVEASPYNPDALSESDVEGLTDVLEGFQRLNRDSNGVVKIGDGVTASGTAEPIKGFYVHDEVTDTDGIAKFSSEELEDIRVGADGTTYGNAGDAVRGQVTDLKSEIDYIIPSLTWTAGEYIDATGIVQSGSGRSISGFVPCFEGETIKYIAETNHSNICGISFWDSEQNFVSGEKNVGTIDTEQTATVPQGGRFARLSIKTNTPDQSETAYLKINRMAERDVIISRLCDGIIKSVSIPSGFTWATNPLVNNLYKVGEEYIADLNVADYKPKGTRYYVDPINGDDGRSGKLVAYPLKTIQAAYSKSDVAEICLYPANYYLNNRFTNTGKSIAFTTVANTRAKFVCGNKMTWTQLDGYTKIWQSPLNNANTVVSDVVKGDVKYSTVDNWASLESTEHTYRCTTYTVFVHSDGEPSEDVMVLQRQLNGTFRYSADGTAFVQNIDFIGGIGGACEMRNTDQSAEAEVKFYAKNCSFTFGTTADGFSSGNGLRATGLTECIIQDCEAKYNTDDGFNYHIDYSGQECNVVEIDCVAHDNGISGGTDNGSTIHDGAKIIRVNTECYDNKGPNIADVNDGTQSVNYGCKCKKSGVNVNYNAQDGTAEMWLYDCDASESLYAISVGINSASIVHVRAGNMDGLLQYGSTAIIDTY